MSIAFGRMVFIPTPSPKRRNSIVNWHLSQARTHLGGRKSVLCRAHRGALTAWRRLSADSAYRERAEHLGRELRRHDGPREVVEHAMRLLEARRARRAG